MARSPKKTKKTQAKVKDLATVFWAEDLECATEYEKLLKNDNIPVIIKPPQPGATNLEYEIMVPEDYIDEAHVIIDSQMGYDDLCDFDLDDECSTYMDLEDDDFEDLF